MTLEALQSILPEIAECSEETHIKCNGRGQFSMEMTRYTKFPHKESTIIYTLREHEVEMSFSDNRILIR